MGRYSAAAASGALASLDTVDTIQIDDDAVTYAKMQNVVADDRLLGRVSGADGIVEELTKEQVKTLLDISAPSGSIVMWHGLIANIPTGYVLCDGTNSTPDLRETFLRGAPAATEAGGVGGADTHTLATNEIPAHVHTVGVQSGESSGTVCAEGHATASATFNSGSAGGSEAHNNMPSYYQILFIMKT